MNLTDYIDRGARVAPTAPCMTLPDGTTLSTHAEFHRLTHRIAAALLSDGLKPGERVAIFSPNDADAFACIVGAIRAGGVWTPVNVASRGAEIADFLNLTGCTRLIYHSSLTAHVSNLLELVASIVTVVSIGPGRPGDPVLRNWIAPEDTCVPDLPADPARITVLAPTGGTTGTPKAVPVSNRQLLLMCLANNVYFPEPQRSRYICATPMTHAAGIVAFPVLAEGGRVIIHQGVKPKEIFDSIRVNRATRILLPPTALYTLLGHPEVRAQDFSSLRYFLVTAAPIAPERLAEAVEVFGPVMTQVFGQTEAPLMCTVLTTEETADAVSEPTHRGRLASCGRPTVVARVEIMGEDGTLLGPGKPGEIVIRSNLVFDGYWNNPEATAETRRPDGWHGTGDIGLRDADGFVYILDRKKDMIITGGFNVFPSEVEAVIHTFPGVMDCAVIGIPDEKWGEAVTAVIEPRNNADIDTDALLALCREKLGPVKTPKSVEIRRLPRSPVGKVLRRELRDEYWVHTSRRI
ncbi:AMP-binding protein [Nocardia sp. NPDC005998]|uniref:class I adenylate-forming enzyme family protein n=1 Tax=Nocardia sp. NPDC005998 TaxID=3156894 RepID=UPI0033AF2F44